MKNKKAPETRGEFIIGTPISKRPKEIKKREVVGHWELYTVVSSREGSKGFLATFLERKTLFYLVFKILDRAAKSMLFVIK